MSYVRETSIEAYTQIKENGLLSKRRWQVYDYLYHHGPCTAKQIILGLKKELEADSGFNARLSELRSMGVVKELGTAVCHVTGHNVILWDVTANLPQGVEKTKNLTLTQLNHEFAKLCQRVELLERRRRLKKEPSKNERKGFF